MPTPHSLPLLHRYTQPHVTSSTPYNGRMLSHNCTVYNKYSVIIKINFLQIDYNWCFIFLYIEYLQFLKNIQTQSISDKP